MTAGTQVRGWSGSSRRRVPRFLLQTPLDVTVLRSGVPDTVPGRSVNVCERGMSAMLAGELVPGESVGIELRLPPAADSLRTRAMVRYQDQLRCGLEFVGLSAEQRAAIREWAKESKAEAEIGAIPTHAAGKTGSDRSGAESASGGARKPKKKRGRAGWVVALILVAIAAGVFWWRWNRGWDELESKLRNQRHGSAEKPQEKVAAEVMEKLLIHKVAPIYPAEARKENLQGIIALDVVVGRDGSVVSMHPLNGPQELARAATDALRWWKFEPYRVNGEPVIVETTVAVEFKQ
jgi:TonB family protein